MSLSLLLPRGTPSLLSYNSSWLSSSSSSYCQLSSCLFFGSFWLSFGSFSVSFFLCVMLSSPSLAVIFPYSLLSLVFSTCTPEFHSRLQRSVSVTPTYTGSALWAGAYHHHFHSFQFLPHTFCCKWNHHRRLYQCHQRKEGWRGLVSPVHLSSAGPVGALH